MNYSEKEMAALINEVETQFADHLKKAEDESETSLAKSEEANKAAKAVETKTEEATLVKTEENEFDYDENDYVEMDKMYASMSKSEQEAHYESIKKNIGVDSESTQTDMKKSEIEMNDLYKSEIEVKDAKISDLSKSLSKLTVAMTDFLKGGKKAPARKAVTHIEHIAKSEEETAQEQKEDLSKLTKNEISQRLVQKIRSGDLKKAEREKINQYYDGDIKFDSIKHLL